MARQIGVNENEYIEALHKVNVRSEKSINAAANLLGQVLNEFINAEFERTYVKDIVLGLKDGVEKTSSIVEQIMNSTLELKNIQNKQKIKDKQQRIEIKWKKSDYMERIEPAISKSGLPTATFIKEAVNEKIERMYHE